MILPDVVIAGAAKCGTTALAMALHRHPDFSLGREKEPRYLAGISPTFTGPLSDEYNQSMVDNQAGYEANFASIGPARSVDASVDYLHHPQSAELVYKANPDASIIIGLRHPLRRAWSEHLHLRRVGGETESFDDALRLEPHRRAAGWIPMYSHAERSRYSAGVAAYLEAFGRDRVFVFTHEDLSAQPAELLGRLSEFLDTSVPIEPAGTHNVGGIPRSRRLYQLMRADSGPARAVRKAVGRSMSGPGRLRARMMIERLNLNRSGSPSDPAVGWIMTRTVTDLDKTEKITGLDLGAYRVGPARR